MVGGAAVRNSRAAAVCRTSGSERLRPQATSLARAAGADATDSGEADFARVREASHELVDSSKRFQQNRGEACTDY